MLGPQIIALLFQHGSFGAGSSEIVSPPLAFFAIGVAAQASVFIIVRVFYSFQEVVTPMKIAFAAAAAIMLCVGLVAASVPAIRASRVDPTTALRAD